MQPDEEHPTAHVKQQQLLATVIVIVLTSAVANTFFLTVLAERAALGPNFPVLVITSFVLGSAATVAVNTVLSRWTSNYLLIIQWRQIPTGKRLVFLGSGSAVIAGCLTVLIVSNGLNSLQLGGGKESAAQDFQVYLHGREFDERRLSRTLDEFAQARVDVEKRFPQKERSTPISLSLYPDMKSYHEETGLILSRGSMKCVPGGPHISAPLERNPNLITGSDGSRTPLHEMAHAKTCQVLGPAFHHVPNWFHEGTAELVRTEREHALFRTMDRMRVWLVGARNAPSAQALCEGSPGENAREQTRFYLTATEFLRFLESRHGPDATWNIIQEIREGQTFEESMRTQFGADCQHLYANWLKSW